MLLLALIKTIRIMILSPVLRGENTTLALICLLFGYGMQQFSVTTGSTTYDVVAAVTANTFGQIVAVEIQPPFILIMVVNLPCCKQVRFIYCSLWAVELTPEKR